MKTLFQFCHFTNSVGQESYFTRVNGIRDNNTLHIDRTVAYGFYCKIVANQGKEVEEILCHHLLTDKDIKK